jgi:hypothetical protein
MSWYTGVVFVHVVTAILLVGSTLLAPFMAASVRRADTVQRLRDAADLFQSISKAVGRAAPVTLLSGLYLAFAGDWWGSGWVEVSLALFALAGVGAFGVLDPWTARLVAAAEAAPDGPVGAELDAVRRERRPAAIEAFLLPGDLTIVFLMTNKPGFAGALAAVGIAVLVGTVLLRVQHVPSDERMAAA